MIIGARSTCLRRDMHRPPRVARKTAPYRLRWRKYTGKWARGAESSGSGAGAPVRFAGSGAASGRRDGPVGRSYADARPAGPIAGPARLARAAPFRPTVIIL
ncbi:hypothetical protein GCM10011534_00590 [Pseudooceanicola nanhaiensis]|uniref:Uncharacterized protein n=1 Tax=Pseudooceanicola nanhaiensis TaxID=375761 RepID=A0A917W9U5_9RHOB|nr:hypothetical protein GCM10011534_00590 [Pseudooceanicola nanhaiensis]